MTEAHSQRKHARLSPSAAHRWAECPGSVAAEEGLPDTPSEAADEGTAAHTLNDRCLFANLDADAYLGQWIDVETGAFSLVKNGERAYQNTEEMAEACQIYLDHVRPLYEGAEVEVEAKLDLSHIPGMEGGTGDFTAYNPTTKTLEIVDFKYGKGVVVEPAEGGWPNWQLGCYALGVAERYRDRGVRLVRLTVVQPRAYHPDGPIRSANFRPIDLLEFESAVTDAARETERPYAPRKAGDHCKFCKARGTCPAYSDAAYLVAADTFGELVGPTALTPDEMADKLGKVHVLRAWLKAFEEYAHAQAVAGNMPTGYKLVPKRATRRWTGDMAHLPADLMAYVEDSRELWTQPELKSPAQVEPLMPGKNKKERAAALAPFVAMVSSGTNLVPIDDARQSIRPSIEEVFGE